MTKFRNIQRKTYFIIAVLALMIALCWMVNQSSILRGMCPDSYKELKNAAVLISDNVRVLAAAQWGAFFILILAAAWIFYSLRKMRNSVAFDTSTKSGTIYLRIQVLAAITFAVLILGTLSIFKVNPKEGNFALIASIFTGIIGIIYSDAIKSITSYFYLSSNKQIHVGDWISLPKQGVDGKIRSVSMLTVTIDNWDNSVSTIPTYTLLNEHMQNFQRILSVNEVGRRLCKSFVIDTSSIHTLNTEDVAKIKSCLDGQSQDTITLKNVEYPTSNLRLYRQFIHHWLKNQKDITHDPRLLATLMEPTAEGIPLQIYVFLLKSQKEYFEKYQSEITEFIIMSMEWFGLRLYQRPSDYQISQLRPNAARYGVF